MRVPRPRLCSLLPLVCAVLMATQAAEAASRHQEVYLETSLLGGVGVGYARNIRDVFGVRVDAAVTRIGHRLDANKYHYTGHVNNTQLAAYGDWFPFGGNFHLSAGLEARKFGLEMEAGFLETQYIKVFHKKIPVVNPGDMVAVQLKWPAIAPYLGLGWGHYSARRSGFGFVADVGLTIGAPSVQVNISDELHTRLDALAHQAEAAVSIDDVIGFYHGEATGKVKKIKLFPQASLGISYRF